MRQAAPVGGARLSNGLRGSSAPASAYALAALIARAQRITLRDRDQQSMTDPPIFSAALANCPFLTMVSVCR